MGVCLDMQGKATEALSAYEAAHAVLSEALGADHPRTYTVYRNINKCRHRTFQECVRFHVC